MAEQTPSPRFRLGIDTSNLRSGGSVTHLREVLRSSEPSSFGCDEVIVWGGKQILDALPTGKPWLRTIYVPDLDQGLLRRTYWQSVRLARHARTVVDILFVPSGSYLGTFRPFVTMSRNMLPFEPHESARYGFSTRRVKMQILRIVQSESYRAANGLIFLNDYARRIVLETVGTISGEVAVIPHGVDERFRRRAPTQQPLSAYSDHNPFRYLYVSAIEPYKHQSAVAEAASALRDEGEPVAVDFVGPSYPPALHELERVLTRLDPARTFLRYLGPVDFEALPRLCHSADAYVFASSCENMPNALLEAMAAALPIACSNRGPLPETLGKAGVYFDPEQPNEVKIAMKKLLRDPVLRLQCASGAYEVAKKYSWRRCGVSTFAFLGKVVSQASPVARSTAYPNGEGNP